MNAAAHSPSPCPQFRVVWLSETGEFCERLISAWHAAAAERRAAAEFGGFQHTATFEVES